MTSPVHMPFDFTEEIPLPTNRNMTLTINPKNENLGKATKGKRSIRLYDEISLCNNLSDEIILSPKSTFEYEGIYDEKEIINSFHNDDVEFI